MLGFFPDRRLAADELREPLVCARGNQQPVDVRGQRPRHEFALAHPERPKRSQRTERSIAEREAGEKQDGVEFALRSRVRKRPEKRETVAAKV
jgi:hypothetical protein